ncbi:MAG: hypothetical protein IJV65_00165 [Kiritimatiellae bacterium]|nr:hypothetical protein [Kiritimatiellia bacterium]
MKITREKIPGGRLWLAAERPEADAVRRFVRSGDALRLPPGCRIPHRSRRGAVWRVDVPGAGDCVLKEYSVVRDRGFWGMAESAFKLRFVHRGLRTMRTAFALRAAGVPTFEPLAFWTDSRGGIRNFLLYRRVEGEVVGDRWMGELSAISPPARPDPPLSRDAVRSFFGRAGELVRRMHDAGFVHTDLHPKNFVTPDPDDPAAPLALIDLDSAYRFFSPRRWARPFAPGRRARHVLRVKSLRRLAQCFKNEEHSALRAFVRAYARRDPEAERRILGQLRFWRARPWHRRLDTLWARILFDPPPPLEARGRREHDLVFSLGYDCKCSQSLRRAGLQHFSYPFDWLTGPPPAVRARILADGFRGWFELSDLDDRGPAPFNRFAAVTRVAFNRVSGLEFRHDFPLDKTLAEGYGAAAAKYARRAERLLAALETARRPLAVFCDGYGCPPVSLAELEEARAILAARFGDKIEVLGVFDDRPGEPHEAEESVSADGKTTRWSLPCGKRTPDGTVVRDDVVSRFLAARVSCPDPHTPAERRERRRAERRAACAKYKARTWLGMVRNKLLFRRYRRLTRLLQKKGIIPANRPGLR